MFKEMAACERKYEGHITFKYNSEVELKVIKDICLVHGLSFSYINNDPVLGNKPFAYGTIYGASKELLIEHMRKVRSLFPDIEVLRIKVEEIVFDERY